MLAAAVSADWQTAADNFAQGGQVRSNILMVIKACIGLGRAEVEAERGDYLVINDKRTVIMRQLA
ncbi:hypothetical protein D3C75_554430 [compost metagenome]